MALPLHSPEPYPAYKYDNLYYNSNYYNAFDRLDSEPNLQNGAERAGLG